MISCLVNIGAYEITYISISFYQANMLYCQDINFFGISLLCIVVELSGEGLSNNGVTFCILKGELLFSSVKLVNFGVGH